MGSGSTPTVTENVCPPVVLSANTVHPAPELQPRPSDQMDVDTPPPAGVRAENPPPPPPPPAPPGGEDATPAPPGHPDDDAKDHEKHATLWYELQGPPVYDGPNRRDKILSFLTWKEENGFVRARNWSKCPLE